MGVVKCKAQFMSRLLLVVALFAAVIAGASVSANAKQASPQFLKEMETVIKEIRRLGGLYEKKQSNFIAILELENLDKRMRDLIASPQLMSKFPSQPHLGLHYTERNGITQAYTQHFSERQTAQFDTRVLLMDMVGTSFETDFYGFSSVFVHLLNLKYRNEKMYRKALLILAQNNGACFGEYGAERQYGELCISSIATKGYSQSGQFFNGLSWARERYKFSQELAVVNPKITAAIKFDLATLEVSHGAKPKGRQLFSSLTLGELSFLKQDPERGAKLDTLRQQVESKEIAKIVRNPDPETLQQYFDTVMASPDILKFEPAAVLVRLLQKGKLPEKFERPLRKRLRKSLYKDSDIKNIVRKLSGNAKLDLSLFMDIHGFYNLGSPNHYPSFLFEKDAAKKSAKAKILYKNIYDDHYSNWGNDVAFFKDMTRVARSMEVVGYPGAAFALRQEILATLKKYSTDLSVRRELQITLASEFLETYTLLAKSLFKQKKHDEVIKLLEALNQTAKNRFENEWKGGSQNIGSTLQKLQPYLATAMGIWVDLIGKPRKISTGRMLDGVFQTAQLAQLGEVALAMQAGIRNSITSNKNAAQLLAKYEAQSATSKHFTKLVSVSGQVSDGFKKALAFSILEQDSLKNRVGDLLPFLENFNTIAPVSRKNVKRSLRQGEALMMITPTAKGVALFIMDKKATKFSRASISPKRLAEVISSLRSGLDPNTTNLKDYSSFNVSLSYKLYEFFFGRAAKFFARNKRIVVISEGAITGLPLHVLVTKDPKAVSDFTKVAWLAKTHAITNAISVSGFVAARKQKGQNLDSTRSPFIGFGDPVFSPFLDQSQGKKNRGALVLNQVFRGGDADLKALSSADPLPETRLELNSIGALVGARKSDIIVGQAASETTVKQLSAKGELAKYKVVYFATHGLVAGELNGTNEPGLVLSVPQKATPANDGLLTASEISTLKLNADWVVLSACNTAAPNKPGAEALSGLAKAFFQAGSRSVLASHWPVVSDAAVKLTTNIFSRIASNNKITRAEALRSTMMSILANAKTETEKHPAYWAPFVLVGNGAD